MQTMLQKETARASHFAYELGDALPVIFVSTRSILIGESRERIKSRLLQEMRLFAKFHLWDLAWEGVSLNE